MRVAIIDARKELRSAIRVLLEQEPEIDVVGEGERMQAIPRLTEFPTVDVVLMDWEVLMPNAAEKIQALRAENPDLKILVLSVHALNRGPALDGGADAFVCKCNPPEELLAELLSLSLI